MANPGEFSSSATTSIQQACSEAIDRIKERDSRLVAVVIAFDGTLEGGTRPELATNLASGEDLAEVLEVVARDLRAALKRTTS